MASVNQDAARANAMTARVTFGVIAVIFLVFIALAGWIMNAPAVPHSRMEAMRLGMSHEEVRSTLGHPSSGSVGTDGVERWFYTRWTWACFIVEFSSAGEVTYFHHDY
jgi:hypothetical protein